MKNITLSSSQLQVLNDMLPILFKLEKTVENEDAKKDLIDLQDKLENILRDSWMEDNDVFLLKEA